MSWLKALSDVGLEARSIFPTGAIMPPDEWEQIFKDDPRVFPRNGQVCLFTGD